MTQRDASSLQSQPEEQQELEIGTRLKELRKAHGMTLRELGTAAALSPSFLSELERGRVEPSISALKRLAAALDVTLTFFFSEAGSSGDVVVLRKGQGRSLRSSTKGPGIEFELLAPEEAEMIEPIYGRYDPGASTGDEPLIHEGEEWGYVLSGRFKVWVGGQVYILQPGDCIYFRGSIPHKVANIGDGVSEYVWVNCPASF